MGSALPFCAEPLQRGKASVWPLALVKSARAPRFETPNLASLVRQGGIFSRETIHSHFGQTLSCRHVRFERVLEREQGNLRQLMRCG